nr:MAG TPA: hypothetical protein [Caudoviricetes sp.]
MKKTTTGFEPRTNNTSAKGAAHIFMCSGFSFAYLLWGELRAA